MNFVLFVHFTRMHPYWTVEITVQQRFALVTFITRIDSPDVSKMQGLNDAVGEFHSSSMTFPDKKSGPGHPICKKIGCTSWDSVTVAVTEDKSLIRTSGRIGGLPRPIMAALQG